LKKVLKGALNSYEISKKQENVILDTQYQLNKNDLLFGIEPNKLAIHSLK